LLAWPPLQLPLVAIEFVLFHCDYLWSSHAAGEADFRPEVEIRPFRACAMHPAIIIGTVRSLWTWLFLSPCYEAEIRQMPRSTERISSFVDNSTMKDFSHIV